VSGARPDEDAHPSATPAGPPAVSAYAGDGGPTALQYAASVASFLLSLFTATTLGAGWYLSTRTDVTTDLLPWLGPDTIRRVWSDAHLIRTGLAFSLPLLLILLAHELGHYVLCRRHRVPATPPLFLPAPLGFGTFGAFIRIRAPIADKRRLLDIGSGGPIAGFLTLLPILLYGVAHSRPAPLNLPAVPGAAELTLLLPGRTVALDLATRLFHGPLPAGTTLDLHPFALAAWVGLLATALNLLPFGQLDGGHVLYAALGRRQRRLAVPLWLLLVAAGALWRGWLLWSAIVLLIGLRHPPVADEETPLGRGRLWVALFCLLLLVLSFSPRPLSLVPVTH